ncbi:MAG: hypothetical protein WBN94_06485 [Methanothrix sp.]
MKKAKKKSREIWPAETDTFILPPGSGGIHTASIPGFSSRGF